MKLDIFSENIFTNGTIIKQISLNRRKRVKMVVNNNLVNAALKTSSKTILIAVINDQNQKRYIGVKLK